MTEQYNTTGSLSSHPKMPLWPRPLIEAPFKRIGMVLFGPLDQSAKGYRFVLIIVDCATLKQCPTLHVEEHSTGSVPINGSLHLVYVTEQS